MCASRPVWVAEQLDLVGCIDRACGDVGAKRGPSVGEMVLAVAVRRASPGGRVILDEEIADELRELCGERLQTHGFDDDYAPTDEGRELERLIDVLFVG